MINHVTLWVEDIEESKKFYQAALKPLGYILLKDSLPKWIGFGQTEDEGRDFWLKEGRVGNRVLSCLAFTARNKRQVDDFYSVAVKAGGKDNGPPGYRAKYYDGYYAAFVTDPNGYNIEAIWDDESKGTKLENWQ